MQVGRILITGAAGQLGRAFLSAGGGASGGLEPVGLGSAEMNVTDPASVRAAVRRVRPAVVVNCAAYTAVDAAERDEAAAESINAVGAGNVAAACAEVGVGLIQMSTDYVFSGVCPRALSGSAARRAGDAGQSSAGYEPTDQTGPRTAYGRTKLGGERAVLAAHPRALVVRTAWVYTGTRRSGRGGDFVATMRRLERERGYIDVVDDQRGSPTYAPDLAAGLGELASAMAPSGDAGPVGARGSRRADDALDALDHLVGAGPRVLHAAGGGDATWRDVARGVFDGVGADPERVRPCATADMPRPAARPAYSVLSGRSWAAAGLTPLRHWREALAEALRTSL